MQNAKLKMKRRLVFSCILHFAFCILAACSLTGETPGATPIPPLAPYNAAVATAEAGGDPKAVVAAYYERGNARLDAGDDQAAIGDYNQAIKLDPTNARAFNNRALARAALGQAV